MKSAKPWMFVVGVLALLMLWILGVGTVWAQVPTGSISGTVYCDANFSYTLDPGEELAGVEVTLWDDLDCSWPVTDTLRSTQDSATDGIYSFTGLPVGVDYQNPACYAVSIDPADPALGLCNYPVWWDLYGVWLVAADPVAEVDFRFQQIWEKSVNGQAWAPDMTVTAQTSDTIEIVDTIFLMLPATVQLPIQGPALIENWNPAELAFLDYQVSEGQVVTSTGVLTWMLPFYPQLGPTVVLTKTFHVEPCTWTETTLQEDLYYMILGVDAGAEATPQQAQPQQSGPQQRPVTIAKIPPDLQIDSMYSAEVSDGVQATFTLEYTNAGGYENDVMIRNDFPPEAPFASSAPSPNRQAVDGSWVEWDLGDLAMNDTGSIDVIVAIEAGLPPSTTMLITDTIYNHVGQPADTTVILFHIEQPPLSLGDLVWYDTDQDGIQDAGEPGVQGIVVDLYDDGACADTVLASDTTDTSGLYGFADLQPGTYCLLFSGIPAGWMISPQNQGIDDGVDSDADQATAQIANINLAVDDVTQDMGVYVEGSIGDVVFCDANANGQFDAGEGIAGVAVSLYDDPGCDGVGAGLLGSQDSAALGAYLFDDLRVGPPGTPICYVVQVADMDPDLGDCTIPVTALSYAQALDANNPHGLDSDFGFSEEPVPPTFTPTPTSTPTRTPIPTVAPEPPAVVPEATTLLLLGGAISSLAGYAGLQARARRRKSE